MIAPPREAQAPTVLAQLRRWLVHHPHSAAPPHKHGRRSYNGSLPTVLWDEAPTTAQPGCNGPILCPLPWQPRISKTSWPVLAHARSPVCPAELSPNPQEAPLEQNRPVQRARVLETPLPLAAFLCRSLHEQLAFVCSYPPLSLPSSLSPPPYHQQCMLPWHACPRILASTVPPSAVCCWLLTRCAQALLLQQARGVVPHVPGTFRRRRLSQRCRPCKVGYCRFPYRRRLCILSL